MPEHISLWHCSPHADGATDGMAEYFALGAADAGAEIRHIRLREHEISPCSGCNACFTPPCRCVQDVPGDAASYLFEILAGPGINVFASPVYFYALPAHFKAWIDRGQRFWALRANFPQNTLPPSENKKALVLMAAGRERGDLLFSGGLRTLAWFLKLFDIKIARKICQRGLNDREDLENNDICKSLLRQAGQNWRQLL